MTQLDPVSAPRRWLGLLVAVLAVVGLLVVVMSLVMSAGAAKVAMLQAAPSSPPSPPHPPGTASADMAGPRSTAVTQPATQSVTAPSLPAVPVPPPLVIRPDAEQPEWKHTSVTLNDPAGEYVVPPLDNHRRLKLQGTIRRLVVSMINGKSSLDASDLDAQEILFVGLIDSGAKVLVHTVGGTVNFAMPINDQSVVQVHANGGRVLFSSRGIAVDGSARVLIVAKDVDFQGNINGEKTDIAVTLSPGGSLKFLRMDGGSRLRYGKADRNDPDPRITRGELLGRAKFSKYDEDD